MNPYKDGREEEAPICENYIEETYAAQVLSYACNYFIIAGNIAIRTIVSEILYLVGCSTESSQDSLVTKYIFLCYLFNTGFFLLLVNANFEGQGSIWAEKIFNG